MFFVFLVHCSETAFFVSLFGSFFFYWLPCSRLAFHESFDFIVFMIVCYYILWGFERCDRNEVVYYSYVSYSWNRWNHVGNHDKTGRHWCMIGICWSPPVSFLWVPLTVQTDASWVNWWLSLASGCDCDSLPLCFSTVINRLVQGVASRRHLRSSRRKISRSDDTSALTHSY